MKSRTLTVVLSAALLLVMLFAGTAVAEEPYSGGTVAETTITPRIVVTAEGLSVAFTAAGTSEPCTWEFGDDSTGTGSPATHTYAAEGSYDITATCGALVLARTVSFAKGLNFTGFESALWGAVALVLIIGGAAVVFATRRRRLADRHLET